MLPDRKKVTLWHYLFLTARTGIIIVNGVLIVPLYLHYIDFSLFGAWLTTGNLLMWLNMADPGVAEVLLQRIGKACGEDDHTDTGKVVASGLAISVIVFLVVMAGGLWLSYHVAALTSYGGPQTDVLENSFRIALPGAAMSLLANTTCNIVYGFQRTKEAGLAQNLIALLGIGVTTGMLAAGFGLISLACSILLTGGLKLAYSVGHTAVLLRQHGVRLQLEKAYTRRFSSVFLYTFGSRLVDTMANNIDLIVVARFVGPQYVAMLELSRRPIRIMLGQINNITVSMLPTLPHLAGTGNLDRLRQTTQTILQTVCWSAGFIAGGFILFNQSLISLWTGPQSFFGPVNNALACLGLLVGCLAYTCSNIIYSLGDIRFNALVSLARNGLYCLALLLVVGPFGLTGLLTTFLLVVFSLDFLLYGRRLRTQVDLTGEQRQRIAGELCILTGLLAVCLTLAYRFDNLSLIQLAGAASLYTLLYGIALYGFSGSFRTVCRQLLAVLQRRPMAGRIL